MYAKQPTVCQLRCPFTPSDFIALSDFPEIGIDGSGALWISKLLESASRLAAPSSPGIGAKKPSQASRADNDVYDRNSFCELMDLRSSFNAVPRARFSAARSASNMYEPLGTAAQNPFLNRSALKLANIDAIIPLKPVLVSQGMDVEDSLPTFTFLDLCGGPGGFSEYLLRRQDLVKEVHGWGMTLCDCKCGWDRGKLGEWIVDENKKNARTFESTPNEDHQSGIFPSKRRKCMSALASLQTRALHLVYGSDGSGDLCQPDNVQFLADSMAVRVDVVVADGGFAGARGRFDQEAAMLPLLISEASAMVQTLQPKGCFVCKFFDMTLPGTVQLVALLALLFERVTVVKPVMSRPASSERYFLGQGFRGFDEEESKEGAVSTRQATVLLNEMLALATAGQTCGTPVDGGEGGGQALITSMRQALARGSPFVAWLRAVNDKLMRSQVEACYAIHARLEMEEGEGEGERSAHEEEENAIDVDSYRQIWGLDKLHNSHREEQ